MIEPIKECSTMSDDQNKAQESDPTSGKGAVNTGGGAYIGGGVNTGGAFVGRDKIVHGDEVGGDKVTGDKITVGDISGGTGIAIGRGAQATVTHGLAGEDVAQLFATIHQQIKARADNPDIDKEEITETVQKIEQENAKGEQANPSKVERWLRNLASMAPDIFELTVECLKSPLAGISSVVRKIAERAKIEKDMTAPD
jgi:hypothetical protein